MSDPPSASALTAVAKRLIGVLVRIASMRRTRQMGDLGDRVRFEDLAGTPFAVALEDYGLVCYEDGQDSMRPSGPRELADELEPARPPPVPSERGPAWDDDERTPIFPARREDADTSPGSPRAMRKVSEETARALSRVSETDRGFPPPGRRTAIVPPPPPPRRKR
jgi:hypothetical protein